MKGRMTVTLRGVELEVEVFNYQSDPDTNAAELEWDFVGLTDAGRDRLKISQQEIDKIEELIMEVMEDRIADDYDSYGV